MLACPTSKGCATLLASRGYSRLAKVLMLALCSLVSNACVSFTRPHPSWSYPVDLGLNAASMAGIRVGFACGTGDAGSDDWSPATSMACEDVQSLIESLGATVVEWDGGVEDPATNETSDFHFAYIDRGLENDQCGWTLGWAIIYLGLFPCVSDTVARAELRFFDEHKHPERTLPLVVETRDIYGFVAIYFHVLDWLGVREPGDERRELRDRLFTFIRGHVYTRGLKLDPARISSTAPQPPQDSTEAKGDTT